MISTKPLRNDYVTVDLRLLILNKRTSKTVFRYEQNELISSVKRDIRTAVIFIYGSRVFSNVIIASRAIRVAASFSYLYKLYSSRPSSDSCKMVPCKSGPII